MFLSGNLLGSLWADKPKTAAYSKPWFRHVGINSLPLQLDSNWVAIATAILFTSNLASSLYKCMRHRNSCYYRVISCCDFSSKTYLHCYPYDYERICLQIHHHISIFLTTAWSHFCTFYYAVAARPSDDGPLDIVELLQGHRIELHSRFAFGDSPSIII